LDVDSILDLARRPSGHGGCKRRRGPRVEVDDNDGSTSPSRTTPAVDDDVLVEINNDGRVAKGRVHKEVDAAQE
jgi:hypothetical protein